MSAGNYSFDIDDQSSGNYEYWDNGALLADAHDEIDSIYWTVDRKVKKIVRTSGSELPDMEFIYNAFGQRLMKIEKPRPGGSPGAVGTWIYTGYIYDAGGNTMAIYNFEREGTEQVLTLQEQLVYGAGRLGILNRDKEISRYNTSTTALTLAEHDDTSRTLGKKIYEFSGHTGNVHLTTTDRTIPVNDGDGTIYTYLPDVNSTADFYPFGLQQPGRNTSMDSYRYAFQGMETDGEKTGNHGGSYTTEFRQYDPRLGRWLSLDPLMAKFPHMSPYVAFDNNPIYYTDPYGLESVNGDGPPNRNGKEDGEVYTDKRGQSFMWWNGAWGASTSVTVEVKAERVEKKPSNFTVVNPAGYYNATSTSRYIGFYVRHPLIAERIGYVDGSGNISSTASRFSSRIGLQENTAMEGSQANAFRHVLWQAIITDRFGADIAREAGNAHEVDPYALEGRNDPTKITFKYLYKADETIDLLNNRIGREIGSRYRDWLKSSRKDIAKEVLEHFKEHGFWVAIQQHDGTYRVSIQKITNDEYIKVKAKLEALDVNGYTEEELKQRQEAIENAKRRALDIKGPK